MWAVDDIATPDALADWLRSRDLLHDGAVVDAGSFVRARALRQVLRAFASRNAHGFDIRRRPPGRVRHPGVRAASALRARRARRPAARARRPWRERSARRDPLACLRGADVRGVEAPQVVPGPALRLALLRRFAQRIFAVVLDVDLREPDEDGGVPAASEDGDVRSAWFVTTLAWKRLRRRDSGALVTVLGLAVATAVLAGVFAGVTIASDRSTAQAIERIPASERSVRAVWFGIPGDASERLAALDGAVDEAFAGFGLDGPTPLILFRESTVAGRFVGITAIDGVDEHVILRSGRLPRTCTPDRCEVLRLRGRGSVAERPGPSDRRGRHGNAALAPALRRLPPLERRGDRGRDRPARARRDERVPPTSAGATRRRRGPRRARVGGGARPHLPHVRVGLANRPRQSRASGTSTRSCSAPSVRASSWASARRRSRSRRPWTS